MCFGNGDDDDFRSESIWVDGSACFHDEHRILLVDDSILPFRDSTYVDQDLVELSSSSALCLLDDLVDEVLEYWAIHLNTQIYNRF